MMTSNHDELHPLLPQTLIHMEPIPHIHNTGQPCHTNARKKKKKFISNKFLYVDLFQDIRRFRTISQPKGTIAYTV